MDEEAQPRIPVAEHDGPHLELVVHRFSQRVAVAEPGQRHRHTGRDGGGAEPDLHPHQVANRNVSDSTRAAAPNSPAR